METVNDYYSIYFFQLYYYIYVLITIYSILYGHTVTSFASPVLSLSR
jgi:hypothetical protein